MYNIEEHIRPAEVAIDFGLRPVGLSSIGRWCLPLEPGWILPERLRLISTCEILPSETRNIVNILHADALWILTCISLVRGLVLRRGATRKPV
jgi:hypothetical protein